MPRSFCLNPAAMMRMQALEFNPCVRAAKPRHSAHTSASLVLFAACCRSCGGEEGCSSKMLEGSCSASGEGREPPSAEQVSRLVHLFVLSACLRSHHGWLKAEDSPACPTACLCRARGHGYTALACHRTCHAGRLPPQCRRTRGLLAVQAAAAARAVYRRRRRRRRHLLSISTLL